MKTIHLIAFFLITTQLASCLYSPVHFDNIGVDSSGHTTYPSITSIDKAKIKELTEDIMSLSPDVDRTEAALVAYEAVLYPKVLANRYRLMSPPNYQNHLVNTGKRDRGLCFHFAQDMMKHLDRPYKTLTLERMMSFQGEFLEHNVPTIRAKGQDIQEAIILDAWRLSSDLLWMKAKDDEDYQWIRYTPPKAKN